MGGSALFMAHMLDIIGKGEVITIDISDDQTYKGQLIPESNM